MAHRVGVCGSCHARFQIPANFAPNRARCRTCGGVVEIGPAVEDAQVAARPASVAAEPEGLPADGGSTPAAAPTPAVPEPARGTSRRPRLLAALVGGLILAALAFGAWQLFGPSSSS